jgi:uncharacterized protein (TIGR02145 family)
MKTTILVSLLALGICINSFGQNTLELTFTAIDGADYAELDSIKVMNLTQGGDTVLFYPDTVLVLDYTVGISETNVGAAGFQVFQNYPNPVTDQSVISLYVPEKDMVSIMVTDIHGRSINRQERVLEKGQHSFRLDPGSGKLVFFTARWRGHSSSIKAVNLSIDNNPGSLEYLGSEASTHHKKASEGLQEFSFSLGDTLLYIGYFDAQQSGMLDAPQESTSYTFQFDTNGNPFACPGMPTVTYEGQVYNTIQIFSQCWLKENLNAGTMIDGNSPQTNNDTIEKYCYDNDLDNCTEYGGLYQWGEAMGWASQSGGQGICPPGWHVPTDDEWKVLEGAVDSQYGIGDPEWDDTGWRGLDAGMNLKTTSGWNSNGNGTDQFGFSALPGGFRSPDFIGVGNQCHWWSSTEHLDIKVWTRQLRNDYSEVERDNTAKTNGYSVRCLKD